MAAVYFTTIPCEPEIQPDWKVQGKPYFCSIFHCANNIVYSRFEDFSFSYERSISFPVLRIMGKCISRHLFSTADCADKILNRVKVFCNERVLLQSQLNSFPWMYIKVNNLFDDSTCILLQWLVGGTIETIWSFLLDSY